MSNTHLLSFLASGMALFLVPAQAAHNTSEPKTIVSVQQEESRAVHVDVDEDEPEIDMDVDADMNIDVDSDVDMDVEVDEPQVDMDEDRDEPEMDAEHDEEEIDVDHDEGDNGDASFTEHEQEKIEKSFAMPVGTARRTLEIDNVWGSIEVVGTASDKVQLAVNKSIRAESKGKIEQA